jgi:SAM-dependent methyltransferase
MLRPLLLATMLAQGAAGPSEAPPWPSAETVLQKVGVTRGICVLLGDSPETLALELAKASELVIYAQLERDADVEAARRILHQAGLYGKRVYIEKGSLRRVHLADNTADAVVAVSPDAETAAAEALRVLRPYGKALLGAKELIKPPSGGVDDWSHPYHGPDNNPQSRDQLARAPYLTQFLAAPRFAPVPQVAVASGGRVFKAFGNIAFHKREEPLLETLVAFNGYNGTVLWRRKLSPGFMIHRNTMIATPEVLYLGDDESCKRIDATSGESIDEIAPPAAAVGGTFWKWMAMDDGILYALIGEQEEKDPQARWKRRTSGWPWSRMSKGYNQAENRWGYGRHLHAIDPETKRVVWSHREDEPVDSRALCMKSGRLFLHRPEARPA